MRLKILFILLFTCLTSFGQGSFYEMAATLAASSSSSPIIVTDFTKSGNHDAEQTGGGLVTASSDLELNNGGSASWVGLYFDNLNIPAGATINYARVSFASQKTETATPVSVTIYGNAVANPQAFSVGTWDIYNRALTTASVAWSNIPAWTIGERSSDTETPDIKTIIQEIVDAGYYTQGDAIVILFKPGGGSVRRRGHDYNVTIEAPTIEISYTL